jgi:hypothetical protein
MGIVLKAFDPKLHRVVAIKVVAPSLASNLTARKRFIREARAAAGVTHDHIVTIHEINDEHSPPFLVMQYISGRSLQQRIDQCGALELKEILRIGLQTASGLAAAHAQGLVHRDIKPANILLENGIERVKITDFGLARAVDDAGVTQSGVVTGTPQYMAPEQARGEAVDSRADLFSLGGVLYAMCTGYAPFRASSSMAVLKKVCEETPRPIRELNPDIPDQVAAIVEKLLEKDARDRYQSATEVASLLGQYLAYRQQPAVFPRPPDVPRPVLRPVAAAPRRSLTLPILLIVVPLFLIPVLLFGGWFILPIDGGSSPARSGALIAALPAILGGLMIVLGVILLIVRLVTRPAPPPLPLVSPAGDMPLPRQRSRAWIVLLVIGLSLLALLTCLVPVALLAGLFFTSVDRSAQPNPEQVISEGRTTQAMEPEELIKTFTTADVPITAAINGRTVTSEPPDGWRIDYTANRDIANDADIPRVHLFKLEATLDRPGRVTFRFQVRSEDVPRAHFELRLEGDPTEVRRGRVIQGSTSWTTYEVSTEIVQADRLNAVVGLDFVINGDARKSVVYFKDVEVLKRPLPGMTEVAPRAGESK